jgi:hypothetical protein
MFFICKLKKGETQRIEVRMPNVQVKQENEILCHSIRLEENQKYISKSDSNIFLHDYEKVRNNF